MAASEAPDATYGPKSQREPLQEPLQGHAKPSPIIAKAAASSSCWRSSPWSVPGCPPSLHCEPETSDSANAAAQNVLESSVHHQTGIFDRSGRRLLSVSVTPIHHDLGNDCSSWFFPHPFPRAQSGTRPWGQAGRHSGAGTLLCSP